MEMANPINPSVPSLPQGGSVPRSASQAAAAPAESARQSAAPGGNPAPVAVQPAQQSAQSAQELAQATRDISEYIQTVSRNLDISVDDELGRVVVRVTDAETGDTVRQIPSDEVLALARFFRAQQADSEAADPIRKGLLVNKEG
jgi:flagellar protein FlaG